MRKLSQSPAMIHALQVLHRSCNYDTDKYYALSPRWKPHCEEYLKEYLGKETVDILVYAIMDLSSLKKELAGQIECLMEVIEERPISEKLVQLRERSKILKTKPEGPQESALDAVTAIMDNLMYLVNMIEENSLKLLKAWPSDATAENYSFVLQEIKLNPIAIINVAATVLAFIDKANAEFALENLVETQARLAEQAAEDIQPAPNASWFSLANGWFNPPKEPNQATPTLEPRDTIITQEQIKAIIKKLANLAHWSLRRSYPKLADAICSELGQTEVTRIYSRARSLLTQREMIELDQCVDMLIFQTRQLSAISFNDHLMADIDYKLTFNFHRQPNFIALSNEAVGEQVSRFVRRYIPAIYEKSLMVEFGKLTDTLNQLIQLNASISRDSAMAVGEDNYPLVLDSLWLNPDRVGEVAAEAFTLIGEAKAQLVKKAAETANSPVKASVLQTLSDLVAKFFLILSQLTASFKENLKKLVKILYRAGLSFVRAIYGGLLFVVCMLKRILGISRQSGEINEIASRSAASGEMEPLLPRSSLSGAPSNVLDVSEPKVVMKP